MAFNILKSLLRKRSPAGTIPRASQEAFVAFVTSIDAPHFLQQHETLESDQASMRLRVGLPARELARRYRVCLVPVSYVDRDPTLASLGNVRAVVVGKLPVSFFTGNPERVLPFVDWIESVARKCRVVVDFSDDLGAAAEMYSQPSLLEIQKRLLNACTATVTGEELRERLAPQSRCGVTVIEDPYESLEAGQPRFAPGSRLQLVWFGVFGPPLRHFLEAQFRGIAKQLSRPVELAFVTSASQRNLVLDMANALRKVNPQFSLRHVPWSIDARTRELELADMVVLPQDAASSWGRVKSHNRFVESIRAGRLVIASPIPAYAELASYGCVQEDLSSAMAWALDHPTDALSRIAAGQDYVEQRFSPSNIARKWERVLCLQPDADNREC